LEKCSEKVSSRRQVKPLTVIAQKGAVEAKHVGAPRFRPLTEPEPEALAGGALLPALVAGVQIIRCEARTSSNPCAARAADAMIAFGRLLFRAVVGRARLASVLAANRFGDFGPPLVVQTAMALPRQGRAGAAAVS